MAVGNENKTVGESLINKNTILIETSVPHQNDERDVYVRSGNYDDQETTYIGRYNWVSGEEWLCYSQEAVAICRKADNMQGFVVTTLFNYKANSCAPNDMLSASFQTDILASRNAYSLRRQKI